MSSKSPANKSRNPEATLGIGNPAKGAIVGAAALPSLVYLAHKYLSSREASNSPLMHMPGAYKGISFKPMQDVPMLATAGSLLGAGIGKIVDTYSNKEASAMSLEDRVLLKMASYFSNEDVKTAIALSEQELSGVKLASEDEVQAVLRDLVMQKLANSFSNEELQSVIKQAEKEDKEDKDEKDEKDEKKSKESKDKKDMKKESADMSVPVITPELAAQLAKTLGTEKVAAMIEQVKAEKEAEKIAAYHYELGQIMGQGLLDKVAEKEVKPDASTAAAALVSPMALGAYRSHRGESPAYLESMLAGGLKGGVGASSLEGALGGAVASAGTHAIGRGIGKITRAVLGDEKQAAWNDTAEDLVAKRFAEKAKAEGGGALATAGKALGATALTAGALYGGKKLYDRLRGGQPQEAQPELPKAASQADVYQALAVLESAGIDTKKLF